MLMQLHSGMILSWNEKEDSAYKIAVRSGGFYCDLELQIIIRMMRSTKIWPSMYQVAYDIGAIDGGFSATLARYIKQHVMAHGSDDRYYIYEIQPNTAGIPNITACPPSKIGFDGADHTVDFIRVNCLNPMEVLQRLNERICYCMPVILVRTAFYRTKEVIEHLARLGYSYYVIMEDADAYKRTLIHQIERSVVDQINANIDRQVIQTLIFVAKGHPVIQHNQMLPWEQFKSEIYQG